jgi:hypothetical protein
MTEAFGRAGKRAFSNVWKTYQGTQCSSRIAITGQ